MKSEYANCQRINETLYHCDSLISMLKLLSGKNSTDVLIESGTHILNMPYTLEDLHNIQIRSNTSKPAVIRCNNNSSNTGVAFLRVRDLIIEHLQIMGCGMEHISTNFIGKGNFLFVHMAIFIQNSTNITLVSVNISSSTGIGLLIYDRFSFCTQQNKSFRFKSKWWWWYSY